MIHFTVISLQPKCRDYRAEVIYTLNVKLAISYLNTCFRMRRITKQMSKLLQEINLQVLRRPHRHPFRQTVLYIINCINNRRINNRQYRQDNFQISTVFKDKKKAMWTKTQLLQACLITISHKFLHSYKFLLNVMQVFQYNKPFLCPTLLWIFVFVSPLVLPWSHCHDTEPSIVLTCCFLLQVSMW